MTRVFHLWSYLEQAPLSWLTVTLLAYLLADRLFWLSGQKSWANPVLVSMLLIGGLLIVTGTEYATYFHGAQFVHFMLGPATVALALPIYENRQRIRRVILPLAAALFAGVTVGVVSALLIGRWIGLPQFVQASLAPKSTTTAVAIGISEAIGGVPSLTVVLVQVTGLIGAVLALPLFALMRVRDERAAGVAMGVAAHGIGTARALQASARMGAFSSIGMALSAILTAVIAPLALRLLG